MMKQCFGDLDPQELCAAIISVISLNPRFVLAFNVRGTLFLFGLEFQNPFTVKFQ